MENKLQNFRITQTLGLRAQWLTIYINKKIFTKVNLVLEGIKTSLIISLEGLRENWKSELIWVGTEFAH